MSGPKADMGSCAANVRFLVATPICCRSSRTARYENASRRNRPRLRWRSVCIYVTGRAPEIIVPLPQQKPHQLVYGCLLEGSLVHRPERIHRIIRYETSAAWPSPAPIAGAPSSINAIGASRRWPGSPHEPRSVISGPALSLVSVDRASPRHRSARDRRSLASGRLSLLLALEIPFSGRATAD
jgi:hypothetical protein